MPTIFGFSARKVLARVGQGLLAVCLSTTAVSAGAREGDIKSDMVTAADVTKAKNVMLDDPKKAVGQLQELKKALETHGLADDVTTIQNVYWLYAQAAADVDCVAAYRAIYQSAALGFVAHFPHRAEVYQKREAKLLKCLPKGTQPRVDAEAWRELYLSSLQDKILLHNVKEARQDIDAQAQAASRVLAAAVEQAAARERTEREEQDRKRENWKSTGEAIFTLLMALGMMSVLFSLYKSMLGGSDHGQSATPAAPSKTTGATSSAKRASPPMSSKASTHRKTVATKGRRPGLVRVRPWD